MNYFFFEEKITFLSQDIYVFDESREFKICAVIIDINTHEKLQIRLFL